jgi:hypothetical protein
MRRREKFANVILTTAMIYCIIMLIYALFISSLSPEQLVQYFLVIAISFFIFAMALKWREEWKVNFVLITLSVAFVIYVLEILLFWGIFSIRPAKVDEIKYLEKVKQAEQAGFNYDQRTKWQVIMDFRNKGIESYPSFFAFSLRETEGLLLANKETIYPLGGISKKLSVYCNESGEWSIYESDEHGFNNPLGLYEKQKLDMVLVGDSFTHGACVNPGEELSGQLRQENRQVLSLGNGGNGPLLELATLKKYAAPLKPKKVLWVYFEGNDLEDLAKNQIFFLLQYLREDFSQNLLQRQSEIDQVLISHIEKKIEENQVEKIKEYQAPAYIKLGRIFILFHLRNELTFRLAGKKIVPEQQKSLSLEQAPPLSLFREILSKAKQAVNSWGGQFYFVYLPAWERYSGTLNPENLYHRNEVLALVKALSIQIIDFEDVMSKHPDPISLFTLRRRAHYTAEGYQLLAKKIEIELNI